MTELEISCQQLTETAWWCAQQINGYNIKKSDAVYQQCDFCKKQRGLFYCFFTEDNLCKCIFCQQKKAT